MTLYISPQLRRRMHHLQAHQLPQVNDEMVFPIDVAVKEDAYEISALLPGVSPEDLDIQIKKNTLSIKGEIHYELKEDTQFLLQERPSGAFSRVINLPDELDAGKVEAEMKNGVLTILVPKAEKALPKTIKVKVVK